MTRRPLDTHLVLWWLKGDPRLPKPVVERLQAPEAQVFVSQASLWGMAIKVSIGRLQVDLPELERQVSLQGFRWLPIHNSHLAAALRHHGDRGGLIPSGSSARRIPRIPTAISVKWPRCRMTGLDCQPQHRSRLSGRSGS